MAPKDSKPEEKAPEEKKEKKIDWEARCVELEEQLALANEKPASCPRCRRADCCGVK